MKLRRQAAERDGDDDGSEVVMYSRCEGTSLPGRMNLFT